MLCRGPKPNLWNEKITFPLEGLHYLIANGIWSHAESERVWNNAFPRTPYQLWDTDPTSNPNAVLKLQDMEMVCPWCHKVGKHDLAKFTLMHVRKIPVCRCPSCGHTFDADTISAEALKHDLKLYLSDKKRW